MKDDKREKIYKELEIAANKYTMQCLMIIVLVMSVVWLFNTLGIFIVDTSLTKICFSGGTLIMFVSMLLVRFVGYSKRWIKYYLLLSLICSITLFGIFMSYHAVLLPILPLMYSAQYTRKVITFTYILTVISVIVSVMLGYYYGLCDANMVLLTNMTRNHYVDSSGTTWLLNQVNQNPEITVPLYFILPRLMILSLVVPVITHISNDIVKKSEREEYLKSVSEVDEMTNLYNRNKYLEMVQDYYPNIEQVSVLFGDLNGLKKVNDTLGHEYGDKLIISTTKLITIFTNEKSKAYRIGGDEFVIIVEDMDVDEVEHVLMRWDVILKEKNQVLEMPISISIGYASGKGKDICDIIKRADQMMYQRKGELKRKECSYS